MYVSHLIPMHTDLFRDTADPFKQLGKLMFKEIQ